VCRVRGGSGGALGDLDCWITGIRRDQSPTRANAPKLGWDATHELWKANPLADWSDDDCWSYIRERGLPYNTLHDRGYIHRDIKESNILISGNAPNLTAKLTDFGLARSFTATGMSGITMAGDMAGTFAYMPPEQIRDFRNVRPTADIYAIGMTAYSLLAGDIALNLGPSGDIAGTVRAIFEGQIVPLRSRVPEIPPQLAEVIERALAKDAAQRWQSAAAMRTALSHVV